MSDSFEKMLAGLRPAEPSPELMARLFATRRLRPQEKMFWLRPPVFFAAAAVVVLAAAAFFIIPRPQATVVNAAAAPAPPAERLVEVFSPVEARNYLVDTEETVLIELPGQPPLRLVRCRWLDEVTCRSEDRDAVLQVLQAREQWVPVTTRVY